MMKKIGDFVERHWRITLITAIIFMSVVIMLTIKLTIKFVPKMYLMGFLAVSIVCGYIFIGYTYYKDAKVAKKNRKGWSISELKNFYEKQFNAVNKTVAEYDYSVINDHNWLFTFNKTVHLFLYLLYSERTFSSFDFAACLIYSLIVEPVAKFNDQSEKQLFAFSCAKKLLSKPFFYYAEQSYPSKTLLNFREDTDNVLEEVNFNFPNEVFTDKVICEIITAYTSSGEVKDLIQFSDVLQKMYMKSK